MGNQSLQERIALLDNSQTEPQNCIGAALFVVGLTDREHYIAPYEVYPYLKALRETRTLEEADLLAFEDQGLSDAYGHWINHMVLIVEKDPLRIMHRAYSMKAGINKGSQEYWRNAPFTETTLAELEKQYNETVMLFYCLR